ncbi:MAG: hypothetical protein SGBAC_003751 [Bacillariaceae sp.]
MVHSCTTLAITIAVAYLCCSCDAFAPTLHQGQQQQQLRCIERKANTNENDDVASSSRRAWVAGLGATILLTANSALPANAVRAIGGAEEDCRAAGNCLEIGELDGAIGWTWGGKDRCEATDPRCGPNGKLMDNVPSGAAVPDTLGLKITDVVILEFGIGTRSDAEKLTIQLGLYGENSPASVKQFLNFITNGLRTTSDLVFENGMGVESVPVALSRGGILAQIEPQKRLDIGIPSQAAAYARSKGKNKVDDFLAQPRPKAIVTEEAVRPRDAAGLLTIPSKGIGYGGTTLESDDEAYSSSFQITAAPMDGKDFDPSQQRVIGQVMDQESMATLARLSSLPTKKGFKGVIPGQNSGPPLLKVTLTGVEVQSVAKTNE